MGQEKDLLDARLKGASWKPSKPGWDHDHCAFCADEICDRPVDEHTSCNAAWVDVVDEYHWVCPVCFEDFRESFRWTVEPGDSRRAADLVRLIGSRSTRCCGERMVQAITRTRTSERQRRDHAPS